MTDAQSDEVVSRAETLVGECMNNLEEEYSKQYEEKAKEYARKAELEETINRAPSSIAAGSIYTAGLFMHEKRTQAQVGAACDVSQSTIRKAYLDIVRMMAERSNDAH